MYPRSLTSNFAPFDGRLELDLKPPSLGPNFGFRSPAPARRGIGIRRRLDEDLPVSAQEMYVHAEGLMTTQGG
jgi:hypothetical protein